MVNLSVYAYLAAGGWLVTSEAIVYSAQSVSLFYLSVFFAVKLCSPCCRYEMAGRESDVGKATALEAFTEEQYAAYVSALCGTLASLSASVPGYEYKRRLLQLSVDSEICAADGLRGVSQLTITAGSKDNDLTAVRKGVLLAKMREVLFKARKMVLFARIAANDGFQAASSVSFLLNCIFCHLLIFLSQVLGGGGIEELLTTEEKKRLEDDRKKRSTSPAEGSSGGNSVKTKAVAQQDFGIAAVLAGLLQGGGGGASGSAGGNSLLSLIAAGGKPKKRGLNKTNSPCFGCQGYGHWADDPECPLQVKKTKSDKKSDGVDG